MVDFDLFVLKNHLIKRGFNAFVCSDNQEAISLITETILDEKDSVVGFGNSIS